MENLENNTGGEATEKVDPATGAIEFKLPSGRTCVVAKGKGKNVREAMRLADGDQTKLPQAIMALTTTIDGKKLTFEEFDDLDMSDYMAIMPKVTDLNF